MLFDISSRLRPYEPLGRRDPPSATARRRILADGWPKLDVLDIERWLGPSGHDRGAAEAAYLRRLDASSPLGGSPPSGAVDDQRILPHGKFERLERLLAASTVRVQAVLHPSPPFSPAPRADGARWHRANAAYQELRRTGVVRGRAATLALEPRRPSCWTTYALLASRHARMPGSTARATSCASSAAEAAQGPFEILGVRRPPSIRQACRSGG